MSEALSTHWLWNVSGAVYAMVPSPLPEVSPSAFAGRLNPAGVHSHE